MEKMISFTRGVPPDESLPKEKLVKCARQAILGNGNLTLQYASAMGFEPLRDWIAEKYNITSEQVIIGQGSLQLLDFLIHSFLSPNDLVFVEQPSYDRSLTLFKRAGIRLKGFPFVNGEIDLKEVENALQNGIKPKAFYIIPDFQNPSGALMSKHNREKLLNLAEHYQFIIIEDGPYRHLRYTGEPVATFLEQNSRQVIHMSSFSKMISPGLRVGFIIAPSQIVSCVRQYAEDSCISASHLNQAIVYNFIKNGWLEDQIASLIILYRERMEAMLNSLSVQIGNRGKWLEPQGGFFIGLTLNQDLDIPDVERCSENGIILSKSDGFFINGGENFIRLPFCALSPDEIRVGIDRLANILKKMPW